MFIFRTYVDLMSKILCSDLLLLQGSKLKQSKPLVEVDKYLITKFDIYFVSNKLI